MVRSFLKVGWVESSRPTGLLRALTIVAILTTAAGLRADDAPSKLVGSASCATAACHGGLGGHKFVGAEFAIWSERDPHSRSYSVLLNDVSRQMAERLNLPKPAHKSAVCLSCHSPATNGESELNATSNRAQRDGVDCEQCHGPAERWLTEHVRTDWKTRSGDEKRRRGFRDLTDVLTRANVCADCHVGGPGRDVNHDLIAAGHPRLFFELSTFHANWPKHWPDETDTKRHPVAEPSTAGSIFEAKLWAVGQVVTAQRHLELLNGRAKLGQREPAKWPELAEWNCFACHHDLHSASWWQSKDESKRPLASFRWNSWPYAMLEPLARQNLVEIGRSDSPLAKLQLHFTSPRPSADAISRDASIASQSLHTWAERLNQADAAKDVLSLKSLEALRHSIVVEDGPRLVNRDWDSATQLFLSLNTLQSAIIAARSSATSAIHQENDRQIQIVLDSMSDTLNFPPGLSSPRDFATQPIDRLQADLRQLQELFSKSIP